MIEIMSSLMFSNKYNIRKIPLYVHICKLLQYVQ